MMLLAPLFMLFILQVSSAAERYEPNWDSIDSRPIPSWYDDAKFGILIQWGVYSVQSFTSEWAWHTWKENKSQEFNEYMKDNYPKRMTYQDFAKDFTAELFNPHQWAEIFHASGAKYVVLSSKHHEGYALWPSKHSFSWNSMDVGPHRDLVGELRDALSNYTDIKYGLYYSLFEWYNPMFHADQAKNFKNLSDVNFVTSKVYPQLIDLVETYHPHVLWSDGDWDAPDSYWKSLEFLSWLYNDSPVKDTVVTNDRWGHDIMCHHGGFLTCADSFNPGVLQKRKWENVRKIDEDSWDYRRPASLADYNTINSIIGNLTSSVSCGGNLLLNVGPTKDGIITPIYEERLRQLGSWLKVNGEGIYGSRPWTVCQNDSFTPGIWYTTNKDKSILYATFSPWPVNNIVTLVCPKISTQTKVQLLGYTGYLEYTDSKQSVEIKLPNKAEITSEWVWTFKIEGVQNVNQNKAFENGISVVRAGN